MQERIDHELTKNPNKEVSTVIGKLISQKLALYRRLGSEYDSFI